MPTALITGIGGQDGSYLAELLLEKDYRVVGTEPDLPHKDNCRIRNLLDRIEIARDDLFNQRRLEKLFGDYQPDEVYNFAANSFRADSFRQPILSTEVLLLASRGSWR